MNRREFLKLGALFSASLLSGSCATGTARLSKPEKQTEKNDKLLLKNASILDVEKGVLNNKKHLLIVSGRIEKILDDKTLASVTPDRVIDLNGRYIMPGLINAHCHMTLPGGWGYSPSFTLSIGRQSERHAEECIKHGVTTVRDMVSPSTWMIDLKDSISSGKVLGPRIITCCALQIDDAYLRQIDWMTSDPFWITVNNPKEGIDAVKKAVDGGADFIKLFQQETELYLPGKKIPVMDVKLTRAISEEAAKHGRICAVHHTTINGLKTSLDGGVTSFEHMVTDKLITDEDIKKLIESGSYMVPTSSVSFSMAFEKKNDPNWGKGDIPLILQERKELMSANIKEYLEPVIAENSLKWFKKYENPDTFEESHLLPWLDPTIFNAGGVTGALNLRALFKAGVNFGCGNDGGVPFIFPGAMGLEMYILEKQQFPTKDVIRMATINNARLLKMDDRIGSIAEGKIADMVVFENNPFETLKNTFHPEMVFMNGELVFKKGS